MAITKVGGRQDILVAEVSFTFAQTVAGALEMVNLPANARVVGGDLIVDTVWDSTTNTLSLGDGITPTRYTTTTTLKALGRTALGLTGYKYTAADTVDGTYAETGAVPTTGAARLQVQYTIADRALENQPVR
jgi:hypothetical protein